MGNQTEKSNNRVIWIDIAKCLLIVLVVLGHSTSNILLKSWLSAFYMAAFFIISGFTMKNKLKMPLWKHIINRTIMLIGPYLLFSFLWIAYMYAKDSIIHSGFSATSALISIFLPYSGNSAGNVYNFWFLPCMFLAQIAIFLVLYTKSWKKIFGILLGGVPYGRYNFR